MSVTKKCPFCAEEIRAEAIKCRYCGSSLETRENSPNSFDARATFQGIGAGSVLRDRYEIIGELGRGGMGVVYKAKDRELDTIVAVKVLGEELARDGRSVRNLMEEAKISMRLTHPHIMRLINFESDDRRKFLVMEFIDGETLEARLAREGKITEPTLVQIASQICEGLGYAHKQKIIHRDIKPSNVMLTSGGEVKIMDFGIARVMKDSMTMVTGRMTTGTLIYMSPEQIEGRDVDARADIYSLGIALYESASGNPPFTQGDITHQHLKIAPKSIAGISFRLNEVILKCLEKDRGKRYVAVDELKAVLERRAETESEIRDRLAREEAVRSAQEIKHEAARRLENEKLKQEREKESQIQSLWQEADANWRKGLYEQAIKYLRDILGIDRGYKAALIRIQEIERDIRRLEEKKREEEKRENWQKRREDEKRVKDEFQRARFKYQEPEEKEEEPNSSINEENTEKQCQERDGWQSMKRNLWNRKVSGLDQYALFFAALIFLIGVIALIANDIRPSLYNMLLFVAIPCSIFILILFRILDNTIPILSIFLLFNILSINYYLSDKRWPAIIILVFPTGLFAVLYSKRLKRK